MVTAANRRPAVLQRRVITIFGLDDIPDSHYSDLDPRHREFGSHWQADTFDKVLAEYARLRALVLGQLAAVSENDLARLQRIRAYHFNSWVPEFLRDDTHLAAVHQGLVTAKQARNFTVGQQQIWSLDLMTFKAWADTLAQDGFAEAQQIYANIAQGAPQYAAGYKFQLFQHMQQRAAYQLVRIEPEYGLPKTTTGFHPRGDARTVVSSTQEPQSQYYGAPLEDRNRFMVDSKVGYKDQQRTGEAFLGELDQYGGTAMVGGVQYGGIDRTQSSQPGLVYNFYGPPPQWVTDQVPVRAQQSRDQRPTAFSGGVFVGNQTMLPPVIIKTPQQNQQAEKVVKRLYDILAENDLCAQPYFISWQEWTGDFRSWVRQVAASLSNYTNADELMQAALQ